jgi:hypothetical protein
MRRAKWIGLTGASAFTLALLYGLQVRYERPIRSWVGYELPSSMPVRWWRCRGVVRPMLREVSTPWTLTYSWVGGFGPGEFSLQVESNGRATLIATPHGDEPQRKLEARLEEQEVATLAATIDQSGLLCQSVEPRAGYMVHDLGRYSISVTSGDTSKEVYFDGCHTLPDGKAFDETSELLDKLESRLGKELLWGPFATTSMPGACDK